MFLWCAVELTCQCQGERGANIMNIQPQLGRSPVIVSIIQSAKICLPIYPCFSALCVNEWLSSGPTVGTDVQQKQTWPFYF
jgi:hypothetical protein